MSETENIVQLLQAGRAEASPERSRRSYDSALKAARRLSANGGGTAACVLGSQAAKELALEAEKVPARQSYWKQAIEALFWSGMDPIVQGGEYAGLIVDIFKDPNAAHATSEKQGLFRHASQILENALEQASSSCNDLSFLLSRKSSLLRAGATLESPGFLRDRRLREAHRAAARAAELTRTDPVLLEYALAEWALARYERTDEKYAERLRKAEETLLDSALDNFEPARFARTEFYRATFRAAETCEQFLLCEAFTTNRRRLWRNSTLFAEAAVQLYYAKYPEPGLSEYLQKARTLLEVSVAAGYRDGRTVVDLAFLHAVLDSTAAGLTVLGDLVLERGTLSWEQILEVVTHASDSDLPTYGLALGIDSGAVLTRLGTFTKRFLNNPELAEALYRAAVRIDPHDPVVLTNLTRFLIRRGHPPDLREARRLVQNIQNFADRRFRWWRPLLSELDALQSTSSSSPNPTASDRIPLTELPLSPDLSDLNSVRQRYRQVTRLEDHHKRGYELEKLLFSLAKITFGTAAPSYRFVRPLAGKIHQVDAFIECRGEKYRCEFKWQKERIGYDDLERFSDKIDVAGVSGLFVSMSGFDERAIAKAMEVRREKAILLIDGEEVDQLMRGCVNFDQLLMLKRSAFDQKSDPYYRIVASSEGP
jgi:hypothetical protein